MKRSAFAVALVTFLTAFAAQADDPVQIHGFGETEGVRVVTVH